MKIFRTDTHIDFLGKRRLAALALAVLSVIMLGSLFIRGLALGLDFTGGTLIEVSYGNPVDLSKVRDALAANGFADSVVQHFGSPRDVLVRLAPRAGEDSAALSGRVLGVLRQNGSEQVEMRRVEYVGAQVGGELTEQGGLAMLFALIGILIYVAMRFEWRFALGAVLATLHDTIVTLGFFSLFQIEFDLNVMAAVRHDCHFRPDPRELPPDAHQLCDRCDECIGQPDAVAHHHDIGYDHAGGGGAVHIRRADRARLCPGTHCRHCHRHGILDLCGQPAGAVARGVARDHGAREQAGRRGGGSSLNGRYPVDLVEQGAWRVRVATWSDMLYS
jgi:hypothetical protein